MKKILYLITGIFATGYLALPVSGFGSEFIYPMDRPAINAKAPANAVLLDVTFAGSRLVAVGERGIIIYSDDSGKTWKQADVPTSVSLTAVSFPTAAKGWAVGHAGVVLHSTDAGETWTRQLNGVTAAELIYDAAKVNAEAKGPDDAVAQRQLRYAKLFVDDGPDKPFLDLYFKNDREGFIIGAYGLIFRTYDGGDTWDPWLLRTENEGGMNLYSIHASENTYYIAGEQGLLLVSRDDGNSFENVDTPYIGTFFDVVTTPSGEVVLAGLLGHAYWSNDRCATFNKSEVPNEVSFSEVIRLDDGTMLFTNQAGMILISNDNGRSIKVLDVPRLAPLSSLIQINNDTFMTVGYGGAIPVKMPSSDPQDMGGQI